MNKRINRYIFIALLVVFTGCNLFSSGSPCGKHIDKRTMVNVLTDVFILESQLSHHQSQQSIRDSVPLFYSALFEKHNITQEQFDNAFECWLLDQDNMTLLMDEVLSSLSIIQSRLNERRADQD